MNVYICRKEEFEYAINLDWKNYQLILFNLIQNAVKYNHADGEVIIALSMERGDEDSDDHYLVTEIIDTGIGIAEHRQQMLFIPFLELKLKQNLAAVQDFNIGMGLACSQTITSKMGGEISLKKSSNNLTIFQFKLPAQVDRSVLRCNEVHTPQLIKKWDQYSEIKVFEQNVKLLQYLNQQQVRAIRVVDLRIQRIEEPSGRNMVKQAKVTKPSSPN